MGNLLVMMASMVTVAPLYVYSRCRQFFQREKPVGTRTAHARASIVGTILMAAFLCGPAAAVSSAEKPGPQIAGEHRAMAQRGRLTAMDSTHDAERRQLKCEGYEFAVSIPEDPMVAGPSVMEAKKSCDRLKDRAAQAPAPNGQ